MRCRLPGPQLPAQTASVAGQMRLGARREGRDFLVPHVDPLDFRLAGGCESVRPFRLSPTMP